MTVDEIPQKLIDILDLYAGKKHSRSGTVVACLAEILTTYDAMRIQSLKVEVQPMKARLRACVERWPEAATGEYDPRCCRFPKSCSATVFDDSIDSSYLEVTSRGAIVSIEEDKPLAMIFDAHDEAIIDAFEEPTDE